MRCRGSRVEWLLLRWSGDVHGSPFARVMEAKPKLGATRSANLPHEDGGDKRSPRGSPPLKGCLEALRGHRLRRGTGTHPGRLKVDQPGAPAPGKADPLPP